MGWSWRRALASLTAVGREPGTSKPISWLCRIGWHDYVRPFYGGSPDVVSCCRCGDETWDDGGLGGGPAGG